MRTSIILVFLALTGATARAEPVAGFAQVLLAEHNIAREHAGVAPLVWSEELEAEARSWADELAARGTMVHADSARRHGAGENLWMGSSGYFGPREMVGLFVAERQWYRHGSFPDVSTTGDWHDVGHYTQIVWRGTQSVGCALARGVRDEFLVCRYWPAGNVYGQLAY